MTHDIYPREDLMSIDVGLLPYLLALYFIGFTYQRNTLVGRFSGDMFRPEFLLLLAPEFMWKNHFWGALSGMAIGFFTMVFKIYWPTSCTCPRMYSMDKSAENTKGKTHKLIKIFSTHSLILLIFFVWHCHEAKTPIAPMHEIAKIGQDSAYMVTFIVMTAPRPGNPMHLEKTISSYLRHFPTSPLDPLHGRMQMVVYTHFSDHNAYDRAKDLYANTEQGKIYLKWIREEGNTFEQSLHFSNAIQDVSQKYDSKYIAIIEDDFPLCPHEWPSMLTALHNINQAMPNHCSLFIGTGASGVFFKSSMAKTISSLLVRPHRPL